MGSGSLVGLWEELGLGEGMASLQDGGGSMDWEGRVLSGQGRGLRN